MDPKWDDTRAKQFTSLLLAWKEANPRPLPWKGERDPYLIWLSEIILQQTRVAQGLPYFERFRARFPDVYALAQASEDEVYKLWEGLGYYSRARNLMESARYIANELNGQFPDSYAGLKSLKGVGPYTAAAIASFAYDLPYAVVDGNVYRVLARVLGLSTPVDTTQGKRLFGEWAQKLLDTDAPGAYNQAIMDFGAMQCKPVSPLCDSCPMYDICEARKSAQVGKLPVKSKRLERRVRYFHYLVLKYQGRVVLRKRREKDIWKNLFDFPLLESETPEMDRVSLQNAPIWKALMNESKPPVDFCSKPYQQTLTHQRIIARFWEFELTEPRHAIEDEYFVEELENLSKFAFPKIVDWYLNDKSLYLEL